MSYARETPGAAGFKVGDLVIIAYPDQNYGHVGAISKVLEFGYVSVSGVDRPNSWTQATSLVRCPEGIITKEEALIWLALSR